MYLENCLYSFVHWAKAYQNLCEIIMFCIQAFPERFSDLSFESAVLEVFDPEQQFSKIHKSVGLFPYAMRSFYFALDHVLRRDEFNKNKISIACISQNYFEMLEKTREAEQT